MVTRKVAKAPVPAVLQAQGSDQGTMQGQGQVVVTVMNASGKPLVNASVLLHRWDGSPATITRDAVAELVLAGPGQNERGKTGPTGTVTFTGKLPGTYIAIYNNYVPGDDDSVVRHADGDLLPGQTLRMTIVVPVEPRLMFEFEPPGQAQSTPDGMAGDLARATVVFPNSTMQGMAEKVGFTVEKPWMLAPEDPYQATLPLRRPGIHTLTGHLTFARRGQRVANEPAWLVPIDDGAGLALDGELEAADRPAQPITGKIGVALSRTETEPTPDLALWTLIRNSTEALSFNHYLDFLDQLFCGPCDPQAPFGVRATAKGRMYESLKARRALPFTDAEAYRVLKAATEAFVMVNCGVLKGEYPFDTVSDNAYLDRRDIPFDGDLRDTLVRDYLESVGGVRMLPYLSVIRRKLPDVPIVTGNLCEEADLCFGIIQERLTNPCLIELIWNYWQEEGMLVQTMNVITQRFQNLRSPLATDPLANTEIDMLRPLNNLLWGYTQDEQHRLTVVRRNYEYDHHYGIRLDGKAVRNMRPADSRSKFLEAFHHLLRLLTTFYKQDDDTTVKADAFPILNALKEVHLILSQGAHNQYGDLPSTARIEMLMQQWLLARPEFREFLPTRVMVAYPEPWMDRVDAMKKLQMWSDTSVMHFRNLAIFGEQLLLSIRYGHWSDVYEATQAFNWARFWRPQAQGYIHAYRAATGVDLTIPTLNTGEEAMLPSVLLRQRLARQQRTQV